jgi:blue copper oxidase
MKTIVLSVGLSLLASKSLAQTQLFVPDTLVGPTINLEMHEDSVQFFSGQKSYTYAYNQYSYLGPTLIFEQGQNMNISVTNSINDTTTVHWHGIHLPSKWDGGPHTMIMSGDTWNPLFTVMDKAATYWYHPHLHMKTALQAIKGAAGFIIVRDPNEVALNLPRSYANSMIASIKRCL